MKKLIFIISLFAIYLPSISQDSTGEKSSKESRKQAKKQKVSDLIRQDEEGILVYSKQSIFGFQLRTNGYGFFIEKGKMKTQSKTNLYSFEFNETKHQKQDKLPNGSGGFTFGNPYIYGKINNFYNVQLGFGQQKMLGQKGNKNGVAVMAVYGGGISIGLLKPYYINTTETRTNENVTIKWLGDESRNDTLFLDQSVPASSAGFFKGFNETKIRPGLFAKTGLRFDYGRYNEIVSAIECGINVEYYFSEMPIMVNNQAKTFFANLYVGFEFGRRK